MITPFIPVPDWFPHENVDGGIAVGDLDGDGTPDLVTFQIDAPPGPNAGLYRVGRGLVGGAVTGGWGALLHSGRAQVLQVHETGGGR